MTHFRDTWRNWTRITTVRIAVQAITFALFLAFVLLTTFAELDRWPGLRFWISKVLEIDPLISLATAITTHTVYKGLLWSLIILIPTVFVGRFFCNWMCPYGTLHQFVGWVFGGAKPRSHGATKPRREESPNRYRASQRLKYYVLVAMLVAALFGTLQIGLLDPICLLYRSFTGAVLPTVSMPLPGWLGEQRLHQGAWLIGFLLFGLLAANVVYPRFFCRVLCPLGALLGLLSRWAWWRIERDADKCGDCDHCRMHCEGACDPHTSLRRAECTLCFNCLEDCPQGALHFARFPPKEHEIAGPDLSRRQVVVAGLTGLFFYPLVRATGRVSRDFSSQLIRPPGATEELEFLARCVKCDQCARVCPTNVIQPAWFEGGLEGLWSPVLNFRIGYCQLHCTACGQVCPTGAIQQVSVAQKLGLAEFSERGPLRLGTAHIDVGRCLPYSAGIACQVCEEVCPTSPKAIRAERPGRRARRGWRGGTAAEVEGAPPVPVVDLKLCIGCGICEQKCPVVGDRRAIYVTAEGETRSRAYSDDRNRSVRL
jgi:polyferredoxin/formate hydrogenlyase subunit 6/NADH:ubiquinone oxidoreductase subunit I